MTLKLVEYMLSFLISFNLFQCREKNIENYKLLASLPNENIKLYAVDWKEVEYKQTGVYEKILIQINEKQKEFSWIVDINPSFAPELILSDIDNDNKNELIVLITKYTGTEVNIQEVHVFKLNNFEEIQIVSLEEIIEKNVKTKIDQGNDSVSIEVSIGDYKFLTKAKKNSAVFWFTDIYFGNHINYYVVNNTLVARVKANVSPTLAVGDIIIAYTFKDNLMKPVSIKFDVINNQNIFLTSLSLKN